jgi:hypothetical protein
MISNATHDIIQSVADQYVPDKHHPGLHVNSRDMWVKLMTDMVTKGFVKPKMVVLLKCARNWETLLTLKLSRLN